MKKILYSIIFVFMLSYTQAQVELDYLDGGGVLTLGGGGVVPVEGFASTNDDGLFARRGFQIMADYNHFIAYGLGVGFGYEYDQFRFNDAAFLNLAQQPQGYEFEGNWRMNKIGMNLVYNIPINIIEGTFLVNLFGELNGGVSWVVMPKLDLYYSEIEKRFVEISYRHHSNAFLYYGYNAGIQFLFNDVWGVNFSYNEVMSQKHKLKYTLRAFDADGNLYEEKPNLNQTFGHYGWQLGVVFYLFAY